MYQGECREEDVQESDPVTSIMNFRAHHQVQNWWIRDCNQHSKDSELNEQMSHYTNHTLANGLHTPRTEPEYGDEFEKWILKQHLELGWNLQPESNQVN